MMRTFRKIVILAHRYLGIALSLLLMVWFISGIAMIYARGMPSLTEQGRLDRMPPLDLPRILLSPTEAARKAELQDPGNADLLMILGRPAYRFSNGPTIVSADTGDVFGPIGPAEALAIASEFMSLPQRELRHLAVLQEADQWTISERSLLPLHKVAVDDAVHTELYVSGPLAEVVLMTTRGSRALAWIAAIPHWLYFAPLRLNDGLWRQVVLWTSGLGAVLVLLGIIVGIIQFSPSRPFIPYSGWMRWHYVTGIVFGAFSLTWVFSGMLLMEPYFWASVGGSGDALPEVLAGGEMDLLLFPRPDPSEWNRILQGRAIKEIEFRRIQGDAYYVAHSAEPRPLLISAKSLQIRTEPFSMESLMTRVRQANPNVAVAESELLSTYDSYYHAHEPKPPLPVLRVKYADPGSTWFYVDPEMCQVVARFTRRERVQRWIYNGFHSLDFGFWYDRRPLWDIGMIALLLGGAASSSIGFFVGMKRLGRN